MPTLARPARRQQVSSGVTVRVNGMARLFGCACVVSAAVLGTVPAPEAVAVQPGPSAGPEAGHFVKADLYSKKHPEASPAGANNWSCVPTAAHPDPVVLVHGTYSNAYASWAYMAPAIKAAGYCVFALNYGGVDGNPSKARGDIRESAQQLAAFVDKVLAATHASRVDIVGYSQGGMMPRWYLRFGGGADPADPAKNKVAMLITLGATHHGTTVSGFNYLAKLMRGFGEDASEADTAARQQETGSALLKTLNADGDTEPGIAYTIIATRYDIVSTPYDATFLKAGPGATVDNITLQNGCEIDHVNHMDLTFDPRALSYVLRALDPAGISLKPACVPVLPLVGSVPHVLSALGLGR